MVPRLLVLRAGYAEVLAAKRLVKRWNGVDVPLVNAGDRFAERVRMHQEAAGRSLADLPLADLLSRSGSKLLIDVVAGLDVDDCRVRLASGQQLEYDILLYALGSNSAGPAGFGVSTPGEAREPRDRAAARAGWCHWCWVDRHRDGHGTGRKPRRVAIASTVIFWFNRLTRHEEYRVSDTETFETARPRLTGLAYRLLGSASEAEDAVQDAYIRWHRADREGIREPAAWLTTVVTNLCLNRLTSARSRRETYVGPWLPEPVLTARSTQALGPLETAEQRESVSMALMLLLERLTPAERAVYVLHEAFGYRHREIAEIIEVSESASQQLLSRARKHLESRPRFTVDRQQWRRIAETFLDAARGVADMTPLEDLLADDVVGWADGGGKFPAARHPALGRDKVVRQLRNGLKNLTLERISRFLTQLQIYPIEANLQPALLLMEGDRAIGVVGLTTQDGRINAIHTVANPDKLGFVSAQLEEIDLPEPLVDVR